MPEKKYQHPRPFLGAELRRSVEVESGHECAVNRCGEHTYLEIHHINGDREDNRVENLILLCDKHHKMAHAGVIDRKALQEYKRLLKQIYTSELLNRIQRLEALLAQSPPLEPTTETVASSAQDPDLPVKSVARRSELMAYTLEQLALAKYERDTGLYLEREPTFTKGSARLRLDAVRQDDELDLVVEVRWLRKRYLDAPIWLRQVEAATTTYELISGRKAMGVLIFIVPKESMSKVADLPLTFAELPNIGRKPEIVIYTYANLGFDPGPISAGSLC